MTLNIATTVRDSATSFLSSIGINTHSGVASGSYANASLVKRSLDYLGINTVRDSFANSGAAGAVVDALAQAGVKFDFVVDSSLPATGAAGLANFTSGLAAFRAKYASSVAFVEGLNEANIQKFTTSTNWAPEAVAFQQKLYSAIKGNAALADLGVINMSIGLESATDYAKVGDLGRYSDFANAHAYTAITANYQSTDAIMEGSLASASRASSGHKTIVTETGFTTYTPYADLGVSELAQAELTLNGLLNSWENGASKTFLYELLDSNLDPTLAEKERHFGLFNADGTPKLAAQAVHNLTTILGFGATGTATATAAFSIGSAPADTHVAALGKSAGVYDLVLWRDAPVWDAKNKLDLAPASGDVAIDLGRLEANVYVYDPLRGTSPIAVYHDVSQISVGLSGHPLIVEIGAASPVVEQSTNLGTNLTMTAAALVANINTIASATGYSTITISGEPVLQVSTIATMQDMLANYGAVLGKVQGDFSFQVTTLGSNWRKEERFDATGHNLSVTNIGLTNGVIASESTVYADGTRIDSSFVGGKLSSSVVTGIDASTLTSAYDTTTGLVLRSTNRKADGSIVTRKFVAGKLSQIDQTNADGSKATSVYDASGALLSQVTVDKVGTWLSTYYDPATGVATKWYLQRKDGSAENYVSGITGQNYDALHQVISATGVATLVEKFRADKTLVSRQVISPDGTNLTVTCDELGRKISEVKITPDGITRTGQFDPATKALTTTIAAYPDGRKVTVTYANGVAATYEDRTPDGMRRFTTFNIVGKSYTEQRERYDATGRLVVLERVHADGTPDYRDVMNADGSRTSVNFDALGRKTTETTVTVLGTIKIGTFDPVTGQNLTGTVKYTSGRKVSSLYTNGVLSQSEDMAADGSKVTLTFDALGRRTSRVAVSVAGDWTTTYLDPATGQVTKAYVSRPDGSGENFTTGISGQSYTQQHQLVNASGAVTLVERWHADGTWDYRDSLLVDGSHITLKYDSLGRQVSATKTLTNGTVALENFDVATGNITMANVRYADGHYITATYTGSVVTVVEEMATDRTKQTDYYDLAGNRSKQVLVSPTGDWTTSFFDTTSGQLTKAYVSHADGSGENFLGNITGQSYSMQRQVVNALGKVTLVERWHADGTRAYTEVNNADGSRNLKNYDATGRLISETQVAPDNSTKTTNYGGTVLGASLNISYGVSQLGMSDFGAVHDLLDMSKLNAGYAPTIALQNVLQTVNPDAYVNLVAPTP